MTVNEFVSRVTAALRGKRQALLREARADGDNDSRLYDVADGIDAALEIVVLEAYHASRSVQPEDVPTDPGAAERPGEPARPGT